MNAPAPLLALLLDSVNSAAPVKSPGEEDDISLNFDLLDLGRLYGCEAAIQRAVSNLIDPIRLGDRYWNVLIEASERDDVDVARMFWRKVTKLDLMVTHGWEWMDRIRPAWREEVMAGLFGRDHLPLAMMMRVAEVELYLREECLDWVNGFLWWQSDR